MASSWERPAPATPLERHTHKHAYYPVITGNSNKQSVSEQQQDFFRFLPMSYRVDLKKKMTNFNMCALNQHQYNVME